MNKLYFWLLFPLTLLVQTTFAQHTSSTTTRMTPNLLSSSGFEQNGTERLNFSVGDFNTVIRLSAQDSISDEDTPQDTTTVSPTLNDSIAKDFTVSSFNAEQNQTDEDSGISAFPNPFNDKVNLTIGDFKGDIGEDYYINLVNFTGNVVHSANIVNPQEEIVFRNVPKGIYFLSLYKNGRKITSIKLLKTNP